ncbi:efflux RND transporter periplasmic adaptor subunit [Algibacillus agarilyticus]|uniref:efflux RND transporter periplasmic adaptor subunit n=1 Tax=Algibacillus agarilyticus TaxID=2234133 RepID=UPI000DD035E4|nr:efflux RND transporter periplasmic adaptor subunit [Algibacillus agarilyticus]
MRSISKKKIIPIAILAGTALVAFFIFSNPPQTKRQPADRGNKLSVSVQQLKAQDIPVVINSFGRVQPRTEGVLIAQVSGQIKQVSPNFRAGGFFKQNEVLLTLDDRDHIANVKIAQANLLSAQQKQLEEQAKSELALIDWQRLGKGKEANALVLRKPQLAVVKANVLSAEAQLAKAELALERTKIIAPYDGRILSKKVDVGQVVTSNAQLADIYATDYVEVRLPIKNADLNLLVLPESSSASADRLAVEFTSSISTQKVWQGTLVRTEGAINTESQQLYVVAQINAPYQNKNEQSLKIGEYVSAKIQGKMINNAISIPNNTLYQGTYVFTVKDDVLQRKDVLLLWQNSQYAIVKSGLQADEYLVTTPLGQVTSGTRVKPSNMPPNNDSIAKKAKRTQPTDTDTLMQKFESLPAERQKKIKQQAAKQNKSIIEIMQAKREQRQTRSGENKREATL